jgi:hypothetical protein
MSAMQEFARRQGEMGQNALLNAIAAQYAGEAFQPLQAKFLKQAEAAQQPIRMGSGMLTPTGEFIRDPEAAQERQLAGLDRREAGLRSAISSREIAAEKANLERQRIEDVRIAREREDRLRRDLAAGRGAGGGGAQRAPSGFQWVTGPDGQPALAPIPGGPADRGSSRLARLPVNAVQDLNKQAGIAETMANLANTFKPDFASSAPGIPGVGNAQNYMGRSGLGSKERANWWQNYNEQANIIRNSLFGSALTLTEKQAFESAMIGPNMDPSVISVRLKQQAAAAQKAYNKIVQSMQASGYDVSGLPSIGQMSAPPPGGRADQPGGRRVVDFNELP